MAKTHFATDADGGIMRRIEMTPTNVNDGRMLGAVQSPDPGGVHADLAYSSSRNEILIRDAGGASRLPGRLVWGGPEAMAKLEAWNREVGHARCRFEKVFGVWKRSYGLRPMRLIGSANAGLQVRLTAIAFNLTQIRNILQDRVRLEAGQVCPPLADGGQKRVETVCRKPKSQPAADGRTSRR